MPSQKEKCENFSQLHQQVDAFIIPNPWDPGTARLMQGMGFKALATTSAGFAFALGKADGQPTLDEKLEHCRALVKVTDIPINVDFEDAYADSPTEVADNVAQLIETGVAGCSVEDFSRSGQYLFDFDAAVERVAAAKTVTGELDFPFILTARCENLIRGVQDLDDTIKRLKAYEAAGADVLYAPGIMSLEDLKTVTAAIDKPFNVLGVMMPQASLADFQAAGATRVSIGNAMTSAALKPLIDYGSAMMENGDFSWVANTASGQSIQELLNNKVG